MHLNFGREEAPGANPGAADLGLHITSLTVSGHQIGDSAEVGFKTSRVRLNGPVKTIALPPAICHADLRSPVIGWNDGGDAGAEVLQCLPTLNASRHVEAALTPIQDAGGRQQTLCQDQSCSPKIAPIVVVTDPVQVQTNANGANAVDAGLNAATVLTGPTPAGLVS